MRWLAAVCLALVAVSCAAILYPDRCGSPWMKRQWALNGVCVDTCKKLIGENSVAKVDGHTCLCFAVTTKHSPGQWSDSLTTRTATATFDLCAAGTHDNEQPKDGGAKP